MRDQRGHAQTTQRWRNNQEKTTLGNTDLVVKARPHRCTSPRSLDQWRVEPTSRHAWIETLARRKRSGRCRKPQMPNHYASWFVCIKYIRDLNYILRAWKLQSAATEWVQIMLINPYLRSQALSIPRGTKKAAELCHDARGHTACDIRYYWTKNFRRVANKPL